MIQNFRWAKLISKELVAWFEPSDSYYDWDFKRRIVPIGVVEYLDDNKIPLGRYDTVIMSIEQYATKIVGTHLKVFDDSNYFPHIIRNNINRT